MFEEELASEEREAALRAPRGKDGVLKVLPDGTRKWYHNGKLHRLRGPAIERADGSKVWVHHGHQYFWESRPLDVTSPPPPDDPPTLVRRNGTREWRNDKGQLHRIGRPAWIHWSGAQRWCVDGHLHRDDGGPTEIVPRHYVAFHVHGLLHRDVGPAKIFHNGTAWWYSHGRPYGGLRVRAPAGEGNTDTVPMSTVEEAERWACALDFTRVEVETTPKAVLFERGPKPPAAPWQISFGESAMKGALC